MKCEGKKMPMQISETRKIRKPLMEKKRRARINDSLEILKQILLESKSTLKESSGKKGGQRTAKLEKADILEMTVHYIQNLRSRLDNQKGQVKNSKEEIIIRPADSTCDQLKVGLTLVPARLVNGELAFIIPPSSSDQEKKFCANSDVWRPW